MQERNVLVLVVVLVVATAGAGVAVNQLRRNDAASWRAFYLTLDVIGTPSVGTNLEIRVTLQQAFLDSRTVPALFLSVDVGTFSIHAATPSTNPWDYPTVWNLTGQDLSEVHLYNVTASPTAAGPATVYAMVWEPLGSLGSVSVDSTGHVNPADISLLASESTSIEVAAAA